MPNTIESRIKERIQSFVTELDILVRRNAFDSLRSVLEGGAPARRGPGRPADTGRPRVSSLVEVIAPAIVVHVKANDGQTVGQISKAIGAAPKAAKKAITQLLASGMLRKSGQKRGTRYHAVSGKVPAAKARRGKRGSGRKARAA